MSYEYPFTEKKLPKAHQKGLLTQSLPDGTGMFSLLIFYQMLNKRSKQHSLLHFLIGKLDEAGFPHPSMEI